MHVAELMMRSSLVIAVVVAFSSSIVSAFSLHKGKLMQGHPAHHNPQPYIQSDNTNSGRQVKLMQEDRVIDEPSQEVDASQEVEEEAADPIQYLASLGNLGPLDMCLLACRMCFVEEVSLLGCVNKACLTDVMMGQPIRDPRWGKMCPGLAVLSL